MVMRLLRRPSAWVPMLLSLAALALIGGYVAAFGVTRPQDEGAAARAFQLLMVAVAAGIVFFGVRWLPRAPSVAAKVLGLQLLVATIPMVTILLLER
jgi:hypothetical protein